jgi:hypothetical protein
MRFAIVVLIPVPDIAPGLIVQVPLAGRPFSTTLPVVAVHDAGWVIVPASGAVGAVGGSFIITSAEACETHPGSLKIVKLYVPGARFVMVTVVPVPVIPPGLMVHAPVAGRPFNTTLPVVAEHEEGCVIVPIIGAVGAVGGTFMITLADSTDIHPAALVTLKL